MGISFGPSDRQDRTHFILSSKVGTHIDKSKPNDVGLGRRHLVDSLEKSLDHLGTYNLDLYMVGVRLFQCFLLCKCMQTP